MPKPLGRPRVVPIKKADIAAAKKLCKEYIDAGIGNRSDIARLIGKQPIKITELMNGEVDSSVVVGLILDKLPGEIAKGKK